MSRFQPIGPAATTLAWLLIVGSSWQGGCRPINTWDSDGGGGDASTADAHDDSDAVADNDAREDVPNPWPDGSPPPLDSDLDGIPDEDEIALGTSPTEEDTDGDGVSDGVEVLAETDPLDAASTIPGTDFYVILPYNDPPEVRELDFTARLGRGDIFFLVDTTGSMGLAIRNVRESLSTIIVPSISEAIADVAMGVGDYRDFPIGEYGASGDWSFAMRQRITPDVGAVQTALDALRAGGGGDSPESMLEGLYAGVAGDCGADAFGDACFRMSSHPIMVVVTDAPSHNGPGGGNDYDASVPARTWDETIATLNSSGVKIVGAAVPIPVPLPIPPESRPTLEALARATSSRSESGSLTVYNAPGGQVSDAVVDGIVDLVGAETQDVTSRQIDDPSDAGGVDATRFIKAVRPLRASRTTSFDETTFFDVPGGTTITFEITFQNDFLQQQMYVQIFRAQIEIHDVPDGIPLDIRDVYIVVPAIGGVLI